MNKKHRILPPFECTHVLVYGDLMLDRYWHGDASRISPEAPVPVVNITDMEVRPGGAANVAQNLTALGGQVSLCGFVGEDVQAQELKTCLDQTRVDCCFVTVPDYPTITKLRVLGRHQQLLRMDFEKIQCTQIKDASLRALYVEKLQTANVVVLSDYAKGALCNPKQLVQLARQKQVPVLVDPKGDDFQRYTGATLLTPNLKEFEDVVGSCRDLQEIIQKARLLLKQISLDGLLVTLGRDGMVLIQPDREATHIPTKARDVFDVTGAGDTVIATLAIGLAAGMEMLAAIELANVAAGIVVGRLGAQTVSVTDLQNALPCADDLQMTTVNESQLLAVVSQARSRGEKIVMTNGCFDILHAGHVDYLSKAKAMGDRLIVAVNDDDSVRVLKGDDRPLNALSARMQVLSALSAVDWVVSFSEETPARLITAVMPDVLVKGGDYQIAEIAGSDVVSQNGGQVRTIPLLKGFSTTTLILKLEARVPATAQ